jgi:SAM-dependent methyltransferase
MPLPIILLIFGIVMALLLLSLRTIAITRVPVVAAGPATVAAALDLLDLEDGERFCEIGCGFGGVVRAARARADVHVLAFELNPAVAALAALRSFRDRKVRIRVQDARTADLCRPDAVYVFLMPHSLGQIRSSLEAQLAPGARVASVDFEIPGWQPVEERLCPGGHAVFFYVMGRQAVPEERPGQA